MPLLPLIGNNLGTTLENKPETSPFDEFLTSGKWNGARNNVRDDRGSVSEACVSRDALFDVRRRVWFDPTRYRARKKPVMFLFMAHLSVLRSVIGAARGVSGTIDGQEASAPPKRPPVKTVINDLGPASLKLLLANFIGALIGSDLNFARNLLGEMSSSNMSCEQKTYELQRL